MIEAVIYDMDGVLIDSEPLWREAEIITFKKVGLSFTDEMCKKTMGMRLNEVIEYWYNKTPWHGMSLKELETELLNTVTALIMDKGQVMDGVKNSLDYFRSKGLKIALASSSAMSLIEVVIDKLGIRNYFDALQSAQNLSFGKPHPEVFLTTATTLKVSPSNCLVIEDSFHGLIAAKAALMKTIVIPEKESWHDPKFIVADYKLKSLTEIPALTIG